MYTTITLYSPIYTTAVDILLINIQTREKLNNILCSLKMEKLLWMSNSLKN